IARMRGALVVELAGDDARTLPIAGAGGAAERAGRPLGGVARAELGAVAGVGGAGTIGGFVGRVREPHRFPRLAGDDRTVVDRLLGDRAIRLRIGLAEPAIAEGELAVGVGHRALDVGGAFLLLGAAAIERAAPEEHP